MLVRDLIHEAGVDPRANTVIFHATDGYTTSFPLGYVMDNDILMAYRMNNVTIDAEHGYPFRWWQRTSGGTSGSSGSTGSNSPMIRITRATGAAGVFGLREPDGELLQYLMGSVPVQFWDLRAMARTGEQDGNRRR